MKTFAIASLASAAFATSLRQDTAGSGSGPLCGVPQALDYNPDLTIEGCHWTASRLEAYFSEIEAEAEEWVNWASGGGDSVEWDQLLQIASGDQPYYLYLISCSMFAEETPEDSVQAFIMQADCSGDGVITADEVAGYTY